MLQELKDKILSVENIVMDLGRVFLKTNAIERKYDFFYTVQEEFPDSVLLFSLTPSEIKLLPESWGNEKVREEISKGKINKNLYQAMVLFALDEIQ